MWHRNRHLSGRDLAELAGGEIIHLRRQERLRDHLDVCPVCLEEYGKTVCIYEWLSKWPKPVFSRNDDLRLKALIQRKMAEWDRGVELGNQRRQRRLAAGRRLLLLGSRPGTSEKVGVGERET